MEKRYFEGNVQIEKREDGSDSRTISGYGIVFNKWSQNFGTNFREMILPEAAADVLEQDIVVTFNHENNLVVGRNKKNTKLTADEVGIRYEFEAPNTTAGNDLLENIRLENVIGSSFSFTQPKEVEWRDSEPDSGVKKDRIIKRFARVIDIGPVTHPAYLDSTAENAKRTFEEYEKSLPPEQEQHIETPDVHERELLRDQILIKSK